MKFLTITSNEIFTYYLEWNLYLLPSITSNEMCTYYFELNFYLFRRMKSILKERHYCDATDAIKNATKELKMLSQNGFGECFKQLYNHWRKRIEAPRRLF